MGSEELERGGREVGGRRERVGKSRKGVGKEDSELGMSGEVGEREWAWRE